MGRTRYLVIFIIAMLCIAVSTKAYATRIVGHMQVLNAVTLKHGDTRIRLWGINPIQPESSVYYLRAMDLLETTANNRELNCKVVGGRALNVIARCISYNDLDLGLELLNKGLAVVDREHIGSSDFSQIYIGAESGARQSQQGVWDQVRENKKEDLVSILKDRLPEELTVTSLMAIPAGIIGFLLLFMWYWMRRMTSAQNAETERLRYKELMLQEREKNILTSILRTELEENRDKVIAFLSVYQDILDNIEDTSQEPTYMSMGETIQKTPFFNKTVFSMNVGKLSLLDIRLANHLSSLYASLPESTEYTNLEPSTPKEEAIATVKEVIDGARDWLTRLDTTLTTLDDSATNSDAA